MGVAKTFTTAYLAIILLVSLTRVAGQDSCKVMYDYAPVVVSKGDNVTCVGWKLEAKCAGLCSSYATIAMKDGGARWYQHCECCQPKGNKTAHYVSWPLNCTDNSTTTALMPIVLPSQCDCLDC